MLDERDMSIVSRRLWSLPHQTHAHTGFSIAGPPPVDALAPSWRRLSPCALGLLAECALSHRLLENFSRGWISRRPPGSITANGQIVPTRQPFLLGVTYNFSRTLTAEQRPGKEGGHGPPRYGSSCQNKKHVGDRPCPGPLHPRTRSRWGRPARAHQANCREMLNGLLDEEADATPSAPSTAGGPRRGACRTSHCGRRLATTSGKVAIRMPRLKGVRFTTAIIERCRRRKTSVKERRSHPLDRACPYAYANGTYLERSWAGATRASPRGDHRCERRRPPRGHGRPLRASRSRPGAGASSSHGRSFAACAANAPRPRPTRASPASTGGARAQTKPSKVSTALS